MKMKAEIVLMGLQAKERQGLLAATRSSERGREQSLPELTPEFQDFWPPEL